MPRNTCCCSYYPRVAALLRLDCHEYLCQYEAQLVSRKDMQALADRKILSTNKDEVSGGKPSLRQAMTLVTELPHTRTRLSTARRPERSQRCTRLVKTTNRRTGWRLFAMTCRRPREHSEQDVGKLDISDLARFIRIQLSQLCLTFDEYKKTTWSYVSFESLCFLLVCYTTSRVPSL